MKNRIDKKVDNCYEKLTYYIIVILAFQKLILLTVRSITVIFYNCTYHSNSTQDLTMCKGLPEEWSSCQ